MPEIDDDALKDLLQAIAKLAPVPLYPAHFARERNLDRGTLDSALDELRLRGLVRFTEWVKDAGQGYTLTEAGAEALGGRLLPIQPVRVESAPEARGFSDRSTIVLRAIFQPKPAYVTMVLLAANLLYFAFGAAFASWHEMSVGDYLQGDSKTARRVLIDLGAIHPILVFPDQVEPNARPQYERIVLFFFLHFGLLHLAMNMYFLYSLGPQIEALWGHARYLAIYFVAGIVSGCMVLLIAEIEQRTPEQTALTAGASGCMFGIFVAMIVWVYFNYHYLPERLIQDWKRNIVINMVLLVAINFVPGISWQGHFGGAVGGLLAALLLHVERFHPLPAVRWLARAGVAAVPIAFFVAVLWYAGRF